MNERQRKKRFRRDRARYHALVHKKFGVGLTDAEAVEMRRVGDGLSGLMDKRTRRGENIGAARMQRYASELSKLRVEIETLLAARRQGATT